MVSRIRSAARPPAYDADVDEMTAAALAVLENVRGRILGSAHVDPVEVVDRYAEELADVDDNEDGEW